MHAFNVTVFSKDAEFKLTQDTFSELFYNALPDFELNTIPPEADFISKLVTHDQGTFWLFTLDGQANVISGVENEDFLVNYPYKREYSNIVIYPGDEYIEKQEHVDYLTKVYGSMSSLEGFGCREKFTLHPINEPMNFNPEKDVLIDEVGLGNQYRILYQNGVMYLDKTRQFTDPGKAEVIIVSTINFVHREDAQFSRNLAVHF